MTLVIYLNLMVETDILHAPPPKFNLTSFILDEKSIKTIFYWQKSLHHTFIRFHSFMHFEFMKKKILKNLYNSLIIIIAVYTDIWERSLLSVVFISKLMSIDVWIHVVTIRPVITSDEHVKHQETLLSKYWFYIIIQQFITINLPWGWIWNVIKFFFKRKTHPKK